jgi:hypothetical protein
VVIATAIGLPGVLSPLGRFFPVAHLSLLSASFLDVARDVAALGQQRQIDLLWWPISGRMLVIAPLVDLPAISLGLGDCRVSDAAFRRFTLRARGRRRRQVHVTSVANLPLDAGKQFWSITMPSNRHGKCLGCCRLRFRASVGPSINDGRGPLFGSHRIKNLCADELTQLMLRRAARFVDLGKRTAKDVA